MDKVELIKDRSVARCILEGYRLFNAQKAIMFHKTWMPLLGSSFGLSMMVVSLLKRQWVGMVIASVFTIIVLILLKRRTFQMISPFPKLSRGIKVVLHHFGGYLTYTLLSSAVCIVIFALLFLPAAILLTAGHVDHVLVMQGDLESLDFGYWALTTVTLLMCFTLILFVQMWQTFGVVYLYGAMVARDKAKKHKTISQDFGSV